MYGFSSSKTIANGGQGRDRESELAQSSDVACNITSDGMCSGTDIFNRLEEKGLIAEYTDLDDKRSKRVELSSEGQRVMSATHQIARKLASMLFHELSEDDRQICIQLLKNVEVKFSALVNYSPLFAKRPSPLDALMLQAQQSIVGLFNNICLNICAL